MVLSSTVEQEQEIADLVDQFYQCVFPKFFTEKEIIHFKEIGVLQPNKSEFIYNGTLRDAFQVITSLQVIKAILEKKEQLHTSSYQKKWAELFEQNGTLLEKCGILFPFHYEQFIYIHNTSFEKIDLSLMQPANQYLI